MSRPPLVLVDTATGQSVPLDLEESYALAGRGPSHRLRVFAALAVRRDQPRRQASSNDGARRNGEEDGDVTVSTATKLLRRQEAADALGVSLSTVDRLRRRGELRSVRVGRGVRFDPRDLNRYLEEIR